MGSVGFLVPQRDQRRISHSGSWQGFKTVIARYPKSGLTVIVLANLAEAQVGAIAYGVAGMIDPTLQAPHLVYRHERQATAGRDSGTAPRDCGEAGQRANHAPISQVSQRRSHGFVSRADRRGPAMDVRGCDVVAALGFTYLGSPIAYACHARSARRTGGGTAVSVFYTADWRAAGVEGYGY